MIQVNSVNGSPQYVPANIVSSHFNGTYFYFFESINERTTFLASLPIVPQVDNSGYKQVSANYTLDMLDQILECVTSNITITMLDATTIKMNKVNIKNTSTGIISVVPVLSQTIDGVNILKISSGSNYKLKSNGLNYLIV